MFLWFLGTALLSVFFVFTDPRFDYRLLLVGSVLPDLIDVPIGQAQWAHSLTVAVGALAVVIGGAITRPQEITKHFVEELLHHAASGA